MRRAAAALWPVALIAVAGCGATTIRGGLAAAPKTPATPAAHSGSALPAVTNGTDRPATSRREGGRVAHPRRPALRGYQRPAAARGRTVPPSERVALRAFARDVGFAFGSFDRYVSRLSSVTGQPRLRALAALRVAFAEVAAARRAGAASTTGRALLIPLLAFEANLAGVDASLAGGRVDRGQIAATEHVILGAEHAAHAAGVDIAERVPVLGR